MHILHDCSWITVSLLKDMNVYVLLHPYVYAYVYFEYPQKHIPAKDALRA